MAVDRAGEAAGRADKGLVHVAKVMAGTALDVIRDETLLPWANADHQERVGGRLMFVR